MQQQAQAASGVDENYTEVTALLDDLVQPLDDHAAAQQATAAQQKEKESGSAKQPPRFESRR